MVPSPGPDSPCTQGRCQCLGCIASLISCNSVYAEGGCFPTGSWSNSRASVRERQWLLLRAGVSELQLGQLRQLGPGLLSSIQETFSSTLPRRAWRWTSSTLAAGSTVWLCQTLLLQAESSGSSVEGPRCRIDRSAFITGIPPRHGFTSGNKQIQKLQQCGCRNPELSKSLISKLSDDRSQTALLNCVSGRTEVVNPLVP